MALHFFLQRIDCFLKAYSPGVCLNLGVAIETGIERVCFDTLSL